MAREESMKDLRSSRRLVKMRQRRIKTGIAPIVHVTDEPKGAAPPILSAVTASGHAIEEQVRKTWSPNAGGLAIF
jgi:hypothetical protein